MEKTTGDRLKKLRLQHNLKLRQVEEMCGVKNATLSKIETNVNEPNSSTLKTLCEFYKVTADYLLFGEKAENSLIDERYTYLNDEDREQIEFLLERAKKRHERETKEYDRTGNL